MTDSDVELVLVGQHATSDGTRKYHTDSDCRYVTESMNEWRRELAEAWGIEECQNCQGNNWATTGKQDALVEGGKKP